MLKEHLPAFGPPRDGFRLALGRVELTRDEMLDDVMLYWLTNTGASSSRSCWDAAQDGGPFNAFDIPNVPEAVTIFPDEFYPAPTSWAEIKKLIYWNEVDKDGHFAAWETARDLH